MTFYSYLVLVLSRPDFISVLLYFSGPSGSMTPIHLVLRIEYAQAGARGSESCCTFSLFLMNRLNKTESAISILYFGLVALEGSTFHQNF